MVKVLERRAIPRTESAVWTMVEVINNDINRRKRRTTVNRVQFTKKRKSQRVEIGPKAEKRVVVTAYSFLFPVGRSYFVIRSS